MWFSYMVLAFVVVGYFAVLAVVWIFTSTFTASVAYDRLKQESQMKTFEKTVNGQRITYQEDPEAKRQAERIGLGVGIVVTLIVAVVVIFVLWLVL